ncbi:MAG TPA: helix-turn-helix transcriptional regulator [Rhizomicrobium sp.]|nr:helix-turn-helix transcriptional regulator [Rhizomicrobium sp.]
MEIRELLSRARERSGVSSNRKLARLIGVDHSSVSNFVSGRNHPSDATMIRISLLAGVPAGEGLLLLNMWRSSPEVAAIYSGLHRQLCKNGARNGK